jgi:hypothetical protein
MTEKEYRRFLSTISYRWRDDDYFLYFWRRAGSYCTPLTVVAAALIFLCPQQLLNDLVQRPVVQEHLFDLVY